MSVVFHSIRWRVQAWYGLILLLVLTAFCLTAYQLARNNQQRRIDRGLFDAERALMFGVFHSIDPDAASGKNLDTPPPSAKAVFDRMKAGQLSLPPNVAARFSGNEAGFFYFVFQGVDGSTPFKSNNIDPATIPPSSNPGERSDEIRTRGNFRENVHEIGQGARTVVGRDITPEIEELRRFTLSLAAAGLGVWLVGLVGGGWIARRAIQPIAKISQTATRIAAGNLNERIRTEGTDNELDQLSRVLNETFERLHQAIDQQKRFTADASHELRTPVTILLSETHRLLKRERTPEEYREALSTCQDAAERMRRLIESLLLLASQENAGTAGKLATESCDLAAIAGASLEQLRPLATEKKVTFRPDLAPAPGQGRPAALSILVNNLLTNAVHHGGGGNVWVTTQHSAHESSLTVRDDGPGVAAEDLPHLFERFYRADKARGSAGSHTGLGLAIAQTIALNHGGRLTVESTPGQGALFRFVLPTVS